MVSCAICKRNFKSGNSLRSHRSRFHDSNREKVSDVQSLSNDPYESKNLWSGGLDKSRKKNGERNIDGNTSDEEAMVVDDEDMRDCSALDMNVYYSKRELINNPKLFKMICKGILDESIPISSDQRVKLKPYAENIREIARIRIHRVNIENDLLQLLMITLQECVTSFEI